MDRASVQSWWEGLATRERRVLGIGALVLVIVAVYLLLWEPPAQGIRKLQADLPQLYAQDASMRAMATEAAGLRAASGSTAAIPPAERVAAVRRTLERAGLWREGAVAGARPAGDDASGAAPTSVSTLSVSGTVTTVSTANATRIDPPEVTTETGERVRVRFENIDYGVWVSWLASTESELAARAQRVSVVALAPKAPVGHVKTDVVLDWTPAAVPGQASRP